MDGSLGECSSLYVLSNKQGTVKPEGSPNPAKANGGCHWPATVRVVGEDGRRVLFLTGRDSRIGVGCRGANGAIDAMRVYPSLQRALFAFVKSEIGPKSIHRGWHRRLRIL
jgi:hypothetical protein